MARQADIEKQPFDKGIEPSSYKGSDSDQDDHVELINASGHVQELDRSFGFWSICSASVAVDNAWVAGAGTLVVALSNGGPPGVLWEFLVVSLLYFPIGASLAELASAIPTSAGVYHWASVTGGPQWGRVCSWYAGWWNCLAYTFGTASAALFSSYGVMGLWVVYHPGFVPERWQIFVVYTIITWLASSIVLFGQRFLSRFTTTMAVILFSVWLVSVLVCAIMPSTTGYGHASHSAVWTEWQNETGWSNNGFVFLAGMLNGAFTIGTPDGATHLAEEVPDAKKNVPKGIAFQLFTGFTTPFIFYITVLYAVTDLNAVFDSPIPAFPLLAMYQQATRSNAGTAALLVLFLFESVLCIPTVMASASRMLWTLGRDKATPFSEQIGKVDHRFHNPFNAMLAIAITINCLGAIFIGSVTAFSAFVGSFVILTTMSYLAAFGPHLLFRRRFVKPGPFWMPLRVAYPVLTVASLYIVVFNVIYCFPFVLPVTPENMNYSVVMTGGVTTLFGLYYLWKRNHGYEGPHVVMEIEGDVGTARVTETVTAKGTRHEEVEVLEK